MTDDTINSQFSTLTSQIKDSQLDIIPKYEKATIIAFFGSGAGLLPERSVCYKDYQWSRPWI